MTSSHISSPPIERQVLNVGILRAGVLAMIALIVGSMFAYDLVLSWRTPLPRPRPSALGTAPALLANPVGPLPSNHSAAPVNTEKWHVLLREWSNRASLLVGLWRL
jgi:hypothetical protein